MTFSGLGKSLRFFAKAIMVFHNFKNRKTIFAKISSFFVAAQAEFREKYVQKRIFKKSHANFFKSDKELVLLSAFKCYNRKQKK